MMPIARLNLADFKVRLRVWRALFAEKILPSHIFLALTAALMFIGFGALRLMRIFADDYSTVSPDFVHIAVTIIIWVISVLLFLLLMLKLRTEKSLSNEGAAYFILAILELGLLLSQTYHTYSYIPRNHALEESTNVANMLSNLNKSMPITINEDITEKSAFFKGHILVLEYTVDNMEEHSWSAATLRPQLATQACDYLERFSKYKSIAAILYSFGGKSKSFIVAYKPEDCTNALSSTPHLSPDKFQHGPY